MTHPHSPSRDRIDRALALRQTEGLPAVEAALQSIASETSGEIECWGHLLGVHMETTEWRECLEDLDHVDRLVGRPSADSLHCRARALAGLRDHGGARAALDQALALNAKHQPALALRALLALRGGEIDSACADLALASELASTSTSPHLPNVPLDDVNILSRIADGFSRGETDRPHCAHALTAFTAGAARLLGSFGAKRSRLAFERLALGLWVLRSRWGLHRHPWAPLRAGPCQAPEEARRHLALVQRVLTVHIDLCLQRGIGWRILNTTLKAPEAAVLLGLIARRRPRFVVEVGRFSGFSTALMAAALEEQGQGEILSIDPEPAQESSASVWAMAPEALARLDVAHRVRLERGHFSLRGMDALVTEGAGDVPILGPGLLAASRPSDLVFVDGDHTPPVAAADVLLAKDHLAPGGIILVHDTVSSRPVRAGLATLMASGLSEEAGHFCDFFDATELCPWGTDGLLAFTPREENGRHLDDNDWAPRQTRP